MVILHEYSLYSIDLFYIHVWKYTINLNNHLISNEDGCLVDNAITHTILRTKKYFQNLTLAKTSVNTIFGYANLIEGSGRANTLLSNGTKLQINYALYSDKSYRNLLSFKDIHQNGYHIETSSEGNFKFLCVTSTILC